MIFTHQLETNQFGFKWSLGWCYFFAGLPLLLILMIGLFSAVASVGMMFLVAAIVFGVLYLFWVTSAELALYPAFHISSFFSLTYRKYETVLHVASVLFFALEVLALLYVLYWFRQNGTKRLWNDDRKPVAYLCGKIFGKYFSKIRTWYLATRE